MGFWLYEFDWIMWTFNSDLRVMMVMKSAQSERDRDLSKEFLKKSPLLKSTFWEIATNGEV